MDGYYEPFQPTLSRSMSGNFLMSLLANKVGSAIPGYGILPPSGFSNTSHVMDRLSKDRMHQEMMAAASVHSQNAIAKTMSGAVGMGMDLAGKQINPAQFQAMERMSNFIGQNTAGFFSQGPQGRAVLDIMAGGNNVANIHSAFAFASRRMGSGITRMDSLSAPEVDQMSLGFFDHMYGDTETSRQRSGGMRAGEMSSVIDYASRRGLLRTGDTMRRFMDNADVVSGISNGSLRQEDLERMGLGEMSQFIGADMNAPEVQQKFQQISGHMAGGSAEGISQTVTAIKEIFERDGVVADIGQLLQTFDSFNSSYGSQLSGASIESVLRTTHVSLREMGYGMKEIKQLSAVMSDIASQHGLETAFGFNMMAGVGTAIGGAGEIFATPSYGFNNREQSMQLQGHATAAFAASLDGNLVGTAIRYADEGFQDSAEGRRLADIANEYRVAGYTSDTEWEAMSPQEKIALIAKATGRTEAEVQQSSGQTFLNEATITQLPGGGVMASRGSQRSSLAQVLQGDLMNSAVAMGFTADEGDLALTMTGGIVDDFLAMDIATQKNYSGPVDENPMNRLGGRQMYDRLVDLTKNGTPAEQAQANAMLNRMGTTEEDRIANLQISHRQATNALYAKGNRASHTAILGDGAMASGMGSMESVAVKAQFEKALAGGTASDVTSALVGMARELGESVDAEGNLTGNTALSDVLKNITNTPTAHLTDGDIAGIRSGMVQQLEDLNALARDESQPAAIRQSSEMRAQQLGNFLDNQFDTIVKSRGLGGTTGATVDADGNVTDVAVPSEIMDSIKAALAELGSQPITMNGVTIELPNGDSIFFQGGSITPNRGTPQNAQ